MPVNGRNPQQLTMAGAFQDAEAAALSEERLFASRHRQLLMTAKECGDDSLKCLCEFVYRKTRRGLGAAWRYESLWPDLADGPFGLCCGRDKAYRSVRLAAKSQLIVWNDVLRTLCIDWNGVFGRRRLPVPQQLLSAGDTSGTGPSGHGRQVKPGKSRKSSPMPPPTGDIAKSREDSIPYCGKPFRNTESHSAIRNREQCPRYISARARSVKSMTTDDEILSVVNSLSGDVISGKAQTVWRKLHGKKAAPLNIDQDSADLILGGLALAQIDREWSDWFRWSVRKTGGAQTHNVGGHFHATLANNLWDRLGLAGIDEENCRSELNSLLRLVRPTTSMWQIPATEPAPPPKNVAEPSLPAASAPELVDQWRRELESRLSARRGSSHQAGTGL